VSRTRSSLWRLVDVAGRCLTVRPPLRMRSRRDPSHAGRRGVAPIARAHEAAQRAAARISVPRKSLTRELRDTIRFSKDALNQTYTTVHVRKLGVTDETRTRFARFTSECLDRFGFDHHAGPGRIERPSRDLESRSPPRRGPLKRRGDQLRADPLVELTGVSERLRCGDPGLRARDD
jgi:hypothetical protein